MLDWKVAVLMWIVGTALIVGCSPRCNALLYLLLPGRVHVLVARLTGYVLVKYTGYSGSETYYWRRVDDGKTT